MGASPKVFSLPKRRSESALIQALATPDFSGPAPSFTLMKAVYGSRVAEKAKQLMQERGFDFSKEEEWQRKHQ